MPKTGLYSIFDHSSRPSFSIGTPWAVAQSVGVPGCKASRRRPGNSFAIHAATDTVWGHPYAWKNGRPSQPRPRPANESGIQVSCPPYRPPGHGWTIGPGGHLRVPRGGIVHAAAGPPDHRSNCHVYVCLAREPSETEAKRTLGELSISSERGEARMTAPRRRSYRLSLWKSPALRG